MDSQNPLIRLGVYGKIKKIMHKFKYKHLKTTDRRLLMGLYFRELKDFAEDHKA